MPLLNTIVDQNPNYKQQVSSIILPFVQHFYANEQADRITAMLVDLPINEIHSYMISYELLEKHAS